MTNTTSNETAPVIFTRAMRDAMTAEERLIAPDLGSVLVPVVGMAVFAGGRTPTTVTEVESYTRPNGAVVYTCRCANGWAGRSTTMTAA